MEDRWATSPCCWSTSSTLGSETSWWADISHTFPAGSLVKWAHVVSHLKEINSSTVQMPLTVSYQGISLRTFRFWVHLHDVVYSLRQFGEIFGIILLSSWCLGCTNWKCCEINRITCVLQGFPEEFIDEIKETLSSSNLYMLAMAALVTAVQVSLHHIRL